jgi:hypothetical protein
MTDTLTPVAPGSSLRGPLLAAHRALRQAVDASCARCKGHSTAALLRVHSNPADASARAAMLQAACHARDLQAALAAFGGPGEIPQEHGFAGYLAARAHHVQQAVARATREVDALSRRQAMAGPQGQAAEQVRQAMTEAQQQLAAHTEFAVLFAAAFGALLAPPCAA